MTKRSLLALVAAVSILAAASASYGAAAKKHAVSDTGTQRTLVTSGNTLVVTGTIKDKVSGQGATVARVVVSATNPNNLQITATAFYKAGTLKVKGVIVASPQPDGSATYVGTLAVAGGTGTFKGAKGKVTFNGAQTAQDQTLITYTLKGSVKY